MLLSLPVIAPEVPAVIEFSAAGARQLHLVLSMSRLGMIQDDDLAGLRRTRMSPSALRTLIEKGWERAVGGAFTFSSLSALARLILPEEDDGEFIDEEGDGLLGIAINAAQPEWIAVGQVFSAIEALHTGLGRKALKIMESSLSHFGIPHTPSGAFELCREMYWMGEDDEKVALEEYGDEAEDADIARRDVLFDGIPEWAYLDHIEDYPSISPEEFGQLAVEYASHPTGKVLAALSRLMAVETEGEFPPAHENFSWPNEPPIVFGWDTDVDFSAVFDDNYRYHMEGGEEPPWVGCVKFDPSEQSITNALANIRHTGRVLGALDQALNEIKECQLP